MDVFIIGAGANVPYGFPTALGLRVDIVEREHFSSFTNDTLLSRLEKTNNLKHEYKNYRKVFKDSGFSSIDKHLIINQSFLNVGKYCIAGSLLKVESTSNFHEEMNENFKSQDWYSYFWNYVSSGIKSFNFLKGNFEKIKIISFNYDRSLEYFLLNAIWNSYHDDFRKRQKRTDDLPTTIYHVYGSLGELQVENGEIANYGKSTPAFDVHQAVSNIKIIDEERTLDSQVNMLVKSADRVFFLGFGFDEQNLEVLGVSRKTLMMKEVFATTYGLEENEILKIKRRLAAKKFTTKSSVISLLKNYLIPLPKRKMTASGGAMISDD